jgi:hypothetical protein
VRTNKNDLDTDMRENLMQIRHQALKASLGKIGNPQPMRTISQLPRGRTKASFIPIQQNRKLSPHQARMVFKTLVLWLERVFCRREAL